MTTKDLQEGVRKRSIVLSFAVDGDFTFAPSTGFVLPDVPSTTAVSYTHLTLPTTSRV